MNDKTRRSTQLANNMRGRFGGLAVLGLLLSAGMAAAAIQSSGDYKANASVDPQANMSLSIADASCDSSNGSTTCNVPAGSTANVNFNILKAITGGYSALEFKVNFSGQVNYKVGSFGCDSAVAPNGTPEVFNSGTPKPSDLTQMANGQVFVACFNFSVVPPSTATGKVAHFQVVCKDSGSGTLTLVAGDGNTDETDSGGEAHSEAANESLTINCSFGTPTNGPTPTLTLTPTRTPTNGPTPTLTPTSIRTPPPTPTRTPTPTPPTVLGDANCDHQTNAIDAALVLQYSAGLIDLLLCPQDADVNHDGEINAVDAALILQYVAGLSATL